MQINAMDTQTHAMEMGWIEPRAARASEGVFAPGEILANRFRVVRFLGQGGMGQVFETFDLELGVTVAVKAIRPEQSRNPAAARQFKREVHLARQVTHGNVCRIFDLFLHHHSGAWGRQGQPVLFLTMEYLAGESLADHLRRVGPLPVTQALPLVHDMAEALDAAHRAGIVHQDFKSSNVMLVNGDQRPRAIVTDFGLAHAQRDCRPGDRELITDLSSDHVSPDNGPDSQKLFAASRRGGTPAYMAPELHHTAELTPAVDIYSFGVVLHELLTGSRGPVEADRHGTNPKGQTEEMEARQHETTVWLPILERCLDEQPRRRYQRAGDIYDALADAGARSSAQPRYFGLNRLLAANDVTLPATTFLAMTISIVTLLAVSLLTVILLTVIVPGKAFTHRSAGSSFAAHPVNNTRITRPAPDSETREVTQEAWKLADGPSDPDRLGIEQHCRTTAQEYLP